MITNNECCSMNDQTNKLNYLFENSSLLPLDLIDYPNQIGGHGLLFGNKSKILYSNVQSTIYKPIQHYPKGPHELEFYQHLFDPNCCNTVLIRLRQFVPDFYGLYRDSEGKHFYLGLKDLLASFKNPSLCDLKMGCRTYAPDSSPSKVMVECAKYKWREEIGFLVTGLKVFYPDIKEYNTYDIFFGRSLNPSTIYDNGIRLFLGRDINRAQKLAHQFVKKLTQLANWFENQTCYHFYASSLLLAYDSVSMNDEKKGVLYPEFSSSHFQHHQCDNSYQVSRKTSTTTVRGETITAEDEVECVLVYLIDFTRWEMVTDCQIKDENFLYGLNYLIQLFERASTDSSPLQKVTSVPNVVSMMC